MKKLFALVLTLAAAPLFAGNQYIPDDVERSVLTVAQMRTIATAIEAYATDHNRYPDAKDLESLIPQIQPLYIIRTPLHDGWGNPFRVGSSATTYRIISAGCDDKFDPATWSSSAKFLDCDADAVPLDGKLIRWWGPKPQPKQ